MDNAQSNLVNQLNNKKTIRAWAIFDWANSAYALTITVAIFPAYYAAATFDEVVFAGLNLSNTALYSFCISFAYLLLALASPILSGIADYSGRKLTFLKVFTVLGALACIGLSFFKGMDSSLAATDRYNQFQLGLGTILFIIGLIGYAGGLVFYNSFLPLIATKDRHDGVSALGFAYGYIGSVILLVTNLFIIQKPELFGLADSGGWEYRIAFLMVGLWWLGFSLVPFKRLPQDPKKQKLKNIVSKGIEEIKSVWNKIKYSENIKRYLYSFFFYSAGVQTVLFLAATFAETQLEFGTGQLIVVILLLQIVAILGTWVFAKVSERFGNILSIRVMLVIWIGLCVAAYFVSEHIQFYIVASLVGLVMGGIQSLSRSTYSKLIPSATQDTASYFSFYDIVEKVAIVSGTLIFGLVDQFLGIRNSILALILFFVIGFILVAKVKVGNQDKQIELEFT